jgi:hypothetical protein
MVQTPEQKKRLRYREALLKNQEPPTRTEASRALLEEVRAELQQEVAAGRAAVKTEARAGKKRLRAAEQAACQSIRDATEHEIKRVKEAARAAQGAVEELPAEAALCDEGQQTTLPAEPALCDEGQQTTSGGELAVFVSAQAWALERDARDREYELLCRAEEARRVEEDGERARLAPEEARHFRQTYERLAAQHAWPALPSPALQRELDDNVAWFFQEDPAFQAALCAKNPKKGRRNSKCSYCSWDGSCARHKVLSAAEEVRLEVELRMHWAEQALLFAVAKQQRAAEEAERQRLASLAREADDRMERKRRRVVAKQARQELNPRASVCRRCWDADFVLGGLCGEHERELQQQIEARLREKTTVEFDTDSE